MPGLIVTLDGSSTKYEQMLARSVTHAKAAGIQIQREYERTQAMIGRRITPIHSMEAMNPASTLINKQAMKSAEQDYVEWWAAQKAMQETAAKDAESLAKQKSLYNAIALGKIEKQEAEALAAQKAMDLERAASAKMAADATILAAAKGQGAMVGMSGGHGAGGMTGIIRESLVILREISMGRGLGRIGGSVTLLAQYLGVLKYAVKSTATEALLASDAATKFSQKMAVLALNAKGTSSEAYFAAQALKAEGQAAKAAEEANIALAGATAKVNWAFFGWVALVVAAAAALYYLIEGAKAAKNSIKDLQDHLAKANDRFADGVETLDAHHQAMLRDAKATAELNDWLERLGKTTASTTDEMDEQLAKMRERFEFQKKLAEQNGASPQQIAAMEKKERDAELAVERAALEKAKKEADDARQAGIAATQKAAEHAKLIDENKGKKDFDKTIEAVEYLNNRIPEEVKSKIAANQKIIDEQKAREANNEQYTDAQSREAYYAEKRNAKLKSTEYGKQSLVGIGDGKAMISPDEVEGIYQQAMAKRALFLKQQEDLQRDQDALEKAKTSTQGTAEQRAQEVKALQKKVDRDADSAALHDQYDSKLQKKGGRLDVTERERIGLGATSSVQVSMLDFTKKIEEHTRESKAVLNFIHTHIKEGAGGFE